MLSSCSVSNFIAPTEPNNTEVFDNQTTINWSISGNFNVEMIAGPDPDGDETKHNVTLINSTFDNITIITESAKLFSHNHSVDSTTVPDDSYNVTCLNFETNTDDNLTSEMFTTHYQITIDNTGPNVTITFPTNTTYGADQTVLNFSVVDAGRETGACWYSLNGGVTNVSQSCTANVTGLSSAEENNTWTVWGNDSLGNEDGISVTFQIDTTSPLIDFIAPTEPNNTEVFDNQTTINWSITEGNLDTIVIYINATDTFFGTNDFEGINKTVTENNYTFDKDDNVSEGWIVLYVWANDTFGKTNQTELRTFLINGVTDSLFLNYTLGDNITILHFTSPEDVEVVNISINITSHEDNLTGYENIINHTFILYNESGTLLVAGRDYKLNPIEGQLNVSNATYGTVMNISLNYTDYNAEVNATNQTDTNAFVLIIHTDEWKDNESKYIRGNLSVKINGTSDNLNISISQYPNFSGEINLTTGYQSLNDTFNFLDNMSLWIRAQYSNFTASLNFIFSFDLTEVRE